MEMFLIVTLTVVLVVLWRSLSGRVETIERQITDQGTDRQDLGDLFRRIYALEMEVGRLRAGPAPAPAIAVAIEPIPVLHAAPPQVIPAPAPLVAPPPLPEPVETPALCAVPPPVETAAPTYGERVREQMAGAEWEAVVGGNWLNKLGVLVLVIGVALFLGYSFTKVGPAGRAGIGAALSLAMLAAGGVLERRPLYRIFGRGLLGGGWAALYFTSMRCRLWRRRR
jgi:uncharacterized membrane protein